MVANKNTKKAAKPAKKVAAKPVKKATAKAAAKPVKKAAAKVPAKKAPAKAPAKPVRKVVGSPAKAVQKPSKPAKKAAAATSSAPVSKSLKGAKAKPVAGKVGDHGSAKTASKTVPASGKATPAVAGGKVERKAAVEPTNGKMSAFVAKQKQRLLDLRDELLTSMFGVTRDTLRNAPEGSEASGSGMHQGDAGSDAYDRDFALSVLAKEQDALYEIDQALKRIDRGTYGICEMSGRRIPQARLEAIPFARLTVECQADWEKEHGNRRFRPSNEVGFGGGIYEEEDESESVSLDEEED